MARAVHSHIVDISLVTNEAEWAHLRAKVPHENTAIRGAGNDLLLIWAKGYCGDTASVTSECPLKLWLSKVTNTTTTWHRSRCGTDSVDCP
jgi:hypothetical protein